MLLTRGSLIVCGVLAACGDPAAPASIDTSSWNTWSLIGVLAALVGHTARLASRASG